MPKGAISLVAAFAVGLLGLLPAAWMLADPGAEVAVVEADGYEMPIEAPTTVAATIPDIPVSVAAVLLDSGHAVVTPEADLAAELPPSVTRALQAAGAVLTIPDLTRVERTTGGPR